MRDMLTCKTTASWHTLVSMGSVYNTYLTDFGSCRLLVQLFFSDYGVDGISRQSSRMHWLGSRKIQYRIVRQDAFANTVSFKGEGVYRQDAFPNLRSRSVRL